MITSGSGDRKSTRLNSSHRVISYAVFCLKKKLSAILSAGLFAFDYYYVPEANRRQDALRDKIKGRPVQTYLRPDRKWIKGAGARIYYYKYYDIAENVMFGVSIYELDPATFRLTREITA